MMKRYILYILALAFPFYLSAQYTIDAKRDYFWPFGYGDSPPYYGGTNMYFNSDSPLIESMYPSPLRMIVTVASMCDTSGNMLFYTNGQYVANRAFEIMPGRDSINAESVYFAGTYNEGYGSNQGAIALPLPGNNHLYYIFHISVGPDYESTALQYSTVDMNLEEGLGDIEELNVTLVQGDSILPVLLQATRHANGRDWWIVQYKQNQNRFLRILFDPEGPHVEEAQEIGQNVKASGQACFSPDGSKYIIYGTDWEGQNGNTSDYNLYVYDFDRCTGLLSNPRKYEFEWEGYIGGCVVSPNSRYLYLSSTDRIQQCDLWADDIGASCEQVAERDGYEEPVFNYPPWFHKMWNGPDGKIYICAGAIYYLHTIEYPDEPGEACFVNQHSIQLPTRTGFTIQNFPNFRLGPLDGSSCDTLGINNPVAVEEIAEPADPWVVRVYPNPVSDYCFVQFAEPYQGAKIIISDVSGREVHRQELSTLISTLEVRDYPSGLYYYRITDEHGVVIYSGTWVKV